MLRTNGILQRTGTRNLKVSNLEAVRKSGGCVNGTMNEKQGFVTGHMEVAARTALGGNNQVVISD